jgi:electron-transferring-flavoprotein dehydrogenase
MTEGTSVLRGSVRPLDHRARLPRERLLVEDRPDKEAVAMDVIFVGGGPAGLAGAIELAKLARRDAQARGSSAANLEIGVLDKAGQLGEHSLSGAVVNPSAFVELFPDLTISDFPFRRPVTKEAVYLLTRSRAMRVPTPPTMRNHGNHVASICEIVRWLGDKAEDLGVNVFPGFPVDSLLVDGRRVVGVRTAPAGLGRDGAAAGPDAMPAMDLTARVTVLAEGTRGALSQAWLDWQGVKADNPQIFALGVKELWEVKRPLDRVVHTMGWPLSSDAFGGSFMYPMSDGLVALGLVAGMDYSDARFDVHRALQRMKLHPLFRPYLEGGEMIEWGAKTIPEGGYYSVPKRRHGDGLVIVGDAAGYVEVSSLKGIHYAMHSGILAARQIFQALRSEDTSEAALAGYTKAVDASVVMRDLKRRRNMRLAFKDGFAIGSAKAGAMTLTGGAFPGGRIAVEEDAARTKTLAAEANGSVPGVHGSAPDANGSAPDADDPAPDGKLTFSKVDAVYRSGNQTRDDIPSHLVVGEDVSPEAAELYVHMCPAGVYERDGDELVVNAPNCIDCKATDVLGPRWTPREGGSGPAYRLM